MPSLLNLSNPSQVGKKDVGQNKDMDSSNDLYLSTNEKSLDSTTQVKSEVEYLDPKENIASMKNGAESLPLKDGCTLDKNQDSPEVEFERQLTSAIEEISNSEDEDEGEC